MGDEIFAILQPENAYLGLATIPATGAGKVKPGQKVNILLDNFPFYEYGMVGGEVLHVSELPKDNLYRVEISMPNGTLTTYGDTLKFRPEMLGSVEIITEDKRVLERILESFIKLFRKKS
jgi:multidrug efflux pump subunit AcrA (membrane-fusion protein)